MKDLNMKLNIQTSLKTALISTAYGIAKFSYVLIAFLISVFSVYIMCLPTIKLWKYGVAAKYIPKEHMYTTSLLMLIITFLLSSYLMYAICKDTAEELFDET